MFEKRLKLFNQVLEKVITTSGLDSFPINQALEMAHFMLEQVRKTEGIVYVIGNGGSAGLASHFCTDLLRTLGIAAATLFDSNTITCFANDFGYENVFKRSLDLKLKSHDLLVALSSSGQSKSIIRAVESARNKKAPIITLSGFASDNHLRSLGDLNFWLDSDDYGLVESGHFFLLHTIIDTFIPCMKKSRALTASAH